MKRTKQKKLIFEKILSIFAWLSFSLAILLAIVTIFASFSDEKNGKEIFGVKFLIVSSDSMSRSALSENENIYFDAGDVIIIKTIDNPTDLKVGDVISFFSYNSDSYGKTLTHKIREVNYSAQGNLIGYTTYGINTGVSDKAIVSPESIIGVYQSKIPKLGSVFSYLKTPLGYYLSVLTPSILLIIFFSIKVGKFLGKREIESDHNYSLEIEDLKARIARLEQKNEISVSASETVVIKKQEMTNEQNALSLISKNKKISFCEKLLRLEQGAQSYFDELHNELCAYRKVHSRLSNKCMSYRFGKSLLAKITVRGKTLKLHLALDVNKFNKNVYFQQDYSTIKVYESVPFTIKVKSNRGKNNAVKLIEILMQEKGVDKNNLYVRVDALKLFLRNIKTEQIESTENNKTLVIAKKSFSEKFICLQQNIKDYFYKIHNELSSYQKIHFRLSYKCMSYRLGKNLLAKITVRGKTLKLHLALDVNKFNKNIYFQRDMSAVKIYEKVPFTIKVKSARAEKNAIKLIQELIQQNNVNKNDKYIPTKPL